MLEIIKFSRKLERTTNPKLKSRKLEFVKWESEN